LKDVQLSSIKLIIDKLDLTLMAKLFEIRKDAMLGTAVFLSVR
jgi:hypothetical protein